MTKTDEAFIHALRRAAIEAVSTELPMRLVLKGGQELSGVPSVIESDFEHVPDPADVMVDPELGAPPEHVITIGDTEVLAQEVREFTVSLRIAGRG